MILTLQEDGVLRVYDTTAEAELDVEALDALETFRAIFDDAGVPHRIEWTVPNSSTRIPGLQVVTNGSYRLVPAAAPDPKALAALLESVEVIDPPARTLEVRRLGRRLRAERG